MASQEFKLGAIIPSEKAAAIDFGSIRTDASAQSIQAAAVAAPESIDTLQPFGSTWKILGNDKVGDCVAVAWANQRRIVTAKLGKTENYPTLDQVYAFYRTQNPKFNPAGDKDTNGPDSSADGGMHIQPALDRLVKNGGPDGVKALAFARVDPSKLDDVRAALATFGNLFVGCRVYEQNSPETRRGDLWSGDSKSKFRGGHAVIVGGYVPEIKFVTWGKTARFSDAYWKGNGGWFSPNIYDLFAVIWPEHMGTRTFMTGVDLQLLAKEYKRITGSNIKFPSIPYNSLHFIKTRQTGSGKVEVHRLPNSSAYAAPDVQASTPLSASSSLTDVYCIENGDLYYISTERTGSGKIEVHRISETSDFSEFNIQTGTAFSLQDARNGSWTIDNGDLYFIKTRNPNSGFVEVHRSNHISNFQDVEDHWVTQISPGEADNGTWTVRQGDLFFIKTKNTESGYIEVHRVDGEANFSNIEHYRTSITVADGANGSWQIGNKGDLYFIKTLNVDSNHIEVHIATSSSSYQDVLHYATWLNATEGPNGLWCV